MAGFFRRASHEIAEGDTEQGFRAAFEQEDGAIGVRLARCIVQARTPAQLGTLLSARSDVDHGMWRDEAWRGRAGQAFRLGEPGVVDGTTANSLATSYRGPRQDGQVAKTNPGAPGCLRILDQSLGQREPAHGRTGRLKKSPARWPGSLKGGLDFPSTHARCCSRRMERPLSRARDYRAAFGQALGGSGSGSGSLSLIR